jgi:hypothetical protein
MAGSGVLVLTKEEELGARCAEILTEMGHDSCRLKADQAFSPTALIETLERGRQQLVFCELKMSPWTALGLLRDLKKASLVPRVAVVALAFDHALHTDFIRLGGAGFAVMDPGYVGLREAINEAWRQVRGWVEPTGGRLNEIVDYLGAANDLELTRGRSNEIVDILGAANNEAAFRRFAVRLFRALDYKAVRESHGAGEAGKDLVFYEKNHMGELEFVGVQAKVGNIHANVSRPLSRNVTRLWLQTVNAFSTRIAFGGKGHFLDKFVLLTSGDFTEEARTVMRALLDPSKYDKRVYMWGRVEIADLIVDHAPAQYDELRLLQRELSGR